MPTGAYRLELDSGAIEDLGGDAEALDLAQEVGDEVAHVAAGLAPKGETGGLADSLHAEAEIVDGEALAKVSWDQDRFYGLFAELGTEHQAATPFLRPALDQTRI